MEYSKIALMIPTFNRVDRVKKIIESAVQTADDPTCLRFVFCVNVNDKVSEAFINEQQGIVKEIIYEKTLQPNLSHYFNKMFDETSFKDAIVSELGDDMVFVSRGWDSRILDEIRATEGRGIVYFDDDFTAHEKCCVNLFITRELVTATRKPFMCPFFHADMIDVVWTMVGAMTGLLRYQSDMIIRHEHNSRKKQDEWDETFKRLVPVQRVANSQGNHRLAISYATLVAKNLIDGGVGRWNTLN